MVNASERLEVRLRPDQRAALQRAAAIAGEPMGRFVRIAAAQRATEVLARHDSFTRLTRPAFERLRDRLSEPVAPSAALCAANESRQLAVTRLTPGHSFALEHFDSGGGTGVGPFRTQSAVDSWLMREAAQHPAESTFVMTDADLRYLDDAAQPVEGFYSVRAHRVIWGDPPFEPGAELPALLLGRLAVQSRRQQEGLGAALLVDALTRLVEVAEVDRADLVVAVAAPDAVRFARGEAQPVAGFYEHFGFTAITDRHLVQRVVDIREAVASPG